MTKIAVITDTHYGVHSDSVLFADHFKKFYDNLFFPTLKERDIKHIIHCGDVFDKPRNVGFNIARRFREDFIKPIVENNIKTYIIVGNHDTYYKTSNYINSMHELYEDRYDNLIHIISDPSQIEIEGISIDLIPWICRDNESAVAELIKKTKSQIMFGHLELYGYEMYRGLPCLHGISEDNFSRYEFVGTGHFHHKSSKKNINYLGAPYDLTWHDFDDERGFHIFDTDTRELEYIQNPYKMHNKVFYNDKEKTLESILDIPYENYKNTIVKIIVKHKENPFWLEKMVENFEKVETTVVIDETKTYLDFDDEQEIEEDDDILESMGKYIDTYDTKSNKDSLKKLTQNIYSEALVYDE